MSLRSAYQCVLYVPVCHCVVSVTACVLSSSLRAQQCACPSSYPDVHYCVRLSLRLLTVCLCDWVLWVCLRLRHSGSAYICPCLSPRLFPYVSPSTQVSPRYSPPRPQVGVSGPLVPGLGPSPSHPRLLWARLGACLQCPATGKHQDPEPKGHLPHLCSLSLSLPRTGLRQSPTGAVPKLETCPDPPLTHGHQPPKPPASAQPCLSVCLLSPSVSLWLVPFSVALPFSGIDLCLHSATVPSTPSFSVLSR